MGAGVLSVVVFDDQLMLAVMHAECRLGADTLGDWEALSGHLRRAFPEDGANTVARLANTLRRVYGGGL